MGIAQHFRNAADDQRDASLSHRLRARRFREFEAAALALPRPIRILDIGGTTEFWENRGWADWEDMRITLVNLEPVPRHRENITPTVGDATDLSRFADNTFDLVFSNSVIEHLFTFENQRLMAREVRRLAPAYWVQTPNYWFPIEPHFLAPGWQWLPEELRVAILRRRAVGWNGRCPDPAKARSVVGQHRLMRRSELHQLFPQATIMPERVGGLVKSWTARHGL
jgi:hypothetical protein